MLSKRLEAVASFVPDEVRMADIGCDHAYLPIALLERKRVTHAIGCDINEGPLEAARKNAARADVDLSVLDCVWVMGFQHCRLAKWTLLPWREWVLV